MKKAMVSISKRILINTGTSDPFLKKVFDLSFPDVQMIMQSNFIDFYSITSAVQLSPQLKDVLHSQALNATINHLFSLKENIPGLRDISGRINLRVTDFKNNWPRFEVTEYTAGKIEGFEIALIYETETLILLDSINDNLLLTWPNTTGKDDTNQLYFENTFFLRLTRDMYFNSYRILQ